MNLLTMFLLAVLAGAFISMGAIFSTVVSAGASGHLPFGVARLLAGLVFSLGLILVVVGGAELFTGNNLIVMAWACRRVRTALLLQNWCIVYLGNLVGALAEIGRSSYDYASLTCQAFLLDNLLPVTLGNVIGGSVMVGAVYWFVYLRNRARERSET